MSLFRKNLAFVHLSLSVTDIRHAGAVYYNSHVPNDKNSLRTISQEKCMPDRYRNVAVFALMFKTSTSVAFMTQSSTFGGLIIANRVNSMYVSSGTVPTDWINQSPSVKSLVNTAAGGLKSESASLSFPENRDQLTLLIPFRDKNHSVVVPLHKFQLTKN